MKTTRLFITALASIPLLVAACDDSLVIDGGGNGGAGGGADTSGGAGTTGGSSSTGGGGVPMPSYENVEPWSENGASCPGSPPGELSACSVEGEVCAYWFDDTGNSARAFRECSCREAGIGSLVFECFHEWGGLHDCPTTEPTNGSSCFGHVGTNCPFPVLVDCSCEDAPDPLWACASTVPAWELPPPPTAPSPTTLVKDLSAAERAAWCNWYDSTRLPAGQPPVPETPLTADGYTQPGGCSFGYSVICDATMADIPVTYCEGNLDLSTCAAPVSELNDCVLTMRNSCWPYDHGCARYLEKPGCMGTILAPALEKGEGGAGSGETCKLKVQ